MLFDDKLSDIIRTLENDGVLLHPSDTVWSLSCSLNSKKAMERIFSMTSKNRNEAFTILVDSLNMLKKYIPHIHPRIETLLHFHHKPLTVIYPNVEHIPSYARNNNKSAPFRIVHDLYCKEIIKLLDAPLISTSANEESRPFPKEITDVSQGIISKVDFVSKRKIQTKHTNQLPVLINYDIDGEINFLRS